jgi:hypothetical protein
MDLTSLVLGAHLPNQLPIQTILAADVTSLCNAVHPLQVTWGAIL